MKNNKKLKNIIAVVSILMASIVTKSATAQITIDPVCSMKVDLSESYDFQFDEKKYFFDTYDCREAFKMNPKKYLDNKCTPPSVNLDLVCGLKVNLEESYDWRYDGKIYYFHSKNCRETFEMNPKKFIDNKCAPQKDLIK